MRTLDLIKRLSQQDSLSRDDMRQLTSIASREGLMPTIPDLDDLKGRLEEVVKSWPVEVEITSVYIEAMMIRSYLKSAIFTKVRWRRCEVWVSTELCFDPGEFQLELCFRQGLLQRIISSVWGASNGDRSVDQWCTEIKRWVDREKPHEST